jgi:hypothetical protein
VTRWREEVAARFTSVVGSCWMHPHASVWAPCVSSLFLRICGGLPLEMVLNATESRGEGNYERMGICAP